MKNPTAENDPIAMSLAAWQAAWRGVGAVHVPDATIRDDVLARYAERHRAYHTQQHLAECLALLATFEALCERPDEVSIAFWFHDAIYVPRRHDNEARSAAWMADVARAAQVDELVIARMRALIMATCHDAQPLENDARVLVDIDLAILGAAPERFDAYERDVRREYRWVPSFMYRRARADILLAFRRRDPLYLTPPMRERFESQARSNLDRSLAALGAASPRTTAQ